MFPVELSGVFELRAATRYRKQYDSWQRYDPPRITLRPALNQSAHHSQTFPTMLYRS